MARGKWTTSFRDKGKAQYAADQINRAATPTSKDIFVPVDDVTAVYDSKGVLTGYRVRLR